MPPAVDAAYRQFVDMTHGEIDPPRLATYMWNNGGRHAVKAMVEFGDIVPQLHRIEGRVRALLGLLEAFDS